MSEELQLVEAARLGDAEAFGKLVQKLDQRLFRTAQRILHHREDAEDAVQNACLKAFQHIAGFRNESRFSTWLLRITINESVGRLAARSQDQARHYDTVAYVGNAFVQRDIADWKLHPERLFARAELHRVLQDALQDLPVGRSVAFILRDVEQFSSQEVARALNLTVGNVKVRVLRARRQLREKLDPHFDAAPWREPAALVAPRTAIRSA